MCIGVTDVTRLENISADEFEELYAYNTKPVIVTDATKDWEAIEVKNIYGKSFSYLIVNYIMTFKTLFSPFLLLLYFF